MNNNKCENSKNKFKLSEDETELIGLLNTNDILKKDLKNIVIPETVITIRKNAFKDCENIKNITFSEGLVNIEEKAFSNCKGLKIIEFPSSLKNIKAKAFAGCKNLEKIIFNEGLKKIGSKVFYKTKVNIANYYDLPNSLEKLYSDSFYNYYENEKNTNIEIPVNIKKFIIAESKNPIVNITKNITCFEESDGNILFKNRMKKNSIIKLIVKKLETKEFEYDVYLTTKIEDKKIRKILSISWGSTTNEERENALKEIQPLFNDIQSINVKMMIIKLNQLINVDYNTHFEQTYKKFLKENMAQVGKFLALRNDIDDFKWIDNMGLLDNKNFFDLFEGAIEGTSEIKNEDMEFILYLLKYQKEKFKIKLKEKK